MILVRVRLWRGRGSTEAKSQQGRAGIGGSPVMQWVSGMWNPISPWLSVCSGDSLGILRPSQQETEHAGLLLLL